jgi:hypothetical protein
METNNISAQLYKKQLAGDPDAGKFGCVNQYGEDLQTCVDDTNSKYQIENAFQSQLDLSDAYKSKQVYEKMKNMFHDQTMEGINGKNIIDPPVFPQLKLQTGTSVSNDPLSVRDNLIKSMKPSVTNTKEFFGEEESGSFFDAKFFLILFLVVAFCYYFREPLAQLLELFVKVQNN